MKKTQSLKNKTVHLSPELRSLVRQSMVLLGQAYKEKYGPQIHKDFLNIRETLKKTRKASSSSKLKTFSALDRILRKKSDLERYALAHGFTLLLEVTNICENAYRSFQLKRNWASPLKVKQGTSTWVITAHPTEARSKEILPLLRQIQSVMEEYLSGSVASQAISSAKLLSLLSTLCANSLAPHEAPRVQDEADYLFKTCLRSALLSDLCDQEPSRTYGFSMHSWVGGDKDGHPGVNADTLLYSWQRSRKELLRAIQQWLNQFIESLVSPSADLRTQLSTLISESASLERIREQDFSRVQSFQKNIQSFFENLANPLSHTYYSKKILRLFEFFPALVVPIELRESSDLIATCLEAKNSKDHTIYQMLELAFNVSNESNITHYVPAFVVSMTHHGQDLSNAYLLQKKIHPTQVIPVVPLFETRKALEDSAKILSDFFNLQPQYFSYIKSQHHSKCEIMLGYSDSSKESGVLFSKVWILKAIAKLEKNPIKPFKLRYFHGSGGAIARGGGTLEEQASGWSSEMRTHFKATYQGEVVTRTFSNSNILLSQIDRLAHLRSQKTKPYRAPKIIEVFALNTAKCYETLISDPHFIQMVEEITLYPYLQELKLGSRPSKRKNLTQVSDLRAIPWVMTWTQLRVLLPSWWGVGETWNTLSKADQQKLKSLYKKGDGFWVAYMKQLSFTLAKMDLDIFEYQVTLRGPHHKHYVTEVRKQYQQTLKMLQFIMGETNIMSHKPWLEESIYLRSSFIHPLNILQNIAMQKQDPDLLRLTTTGIASGMMTTG